MKAKYLLLTALLLWSIGHPIAQTVPANALFRQRLDEIFQNVNKSNATTGYLAEYAIPFLPLDTYNGTLSDSSRMDMDTFRLLFATISSASLPNSTNTLLPTIADLNARITAASSNSNIAIAIQTVEYNKLRSDAITSNLLQARNNILYCKLLRQVGQ